MARILDGKAAAAGIRADLNRAYAAVATPVGYDPAAFRVALGRATAGGLCDAYQNCRACVGGDGG